MKYPCSCTHADQITAKLDLSELVEAFQQAAQWIFRRGKQAFHAPYYERTFRKLYNGVLTGYEKKRPITGLRYEDPDMRYLVMYRHNIARFSAAKTVAMVGQLNTLKNQHPDNYAAFKKGVDALGIQYNENHLQTEYNFSVAVGQMGATWLNLLDNERTFPYVQFQTAGDSRVRPAHRLLDGLYFRIGSKELDFVYPPLGFGCRCDVKAASETHAQNGQIATLKDVTDRLQATPGARQGESEYDTLRRHGFGVNRGKLETIFRENELYLCRWKDTTLTFADYGLVPRAAMDPVQLPDTMAFPRTPERMKAWFYEKSRYTPDQENVWTQSNVFGLPVRFNERDYTYSTQGEAGNYVDYIVDTVSHPTEVYSQRREKGYMTRYLKVYRTHSLVVETRIEPGVEEYIQNLVLVSPTETDGYRTGILQH